MLASRSSAPASSCSLAIAEEATLLISVLHLSVLITRHNRATPLGLQNGTKHLPGRWSSVFGAGGPAGLLGSVRWVR
jgi:hypothetical protein